MAVAKQNLTDDALGQWLQTRWADGNPTSGQLSAFERFSEVGIPHRRVEGWRWSDLRGALRDFSPAANDRQSKELIKPSEFAELNPVEIVVINGAVDVPAANLPEGLTIQMITGSSAVYEMVDGLVDNGLTALSSAMSREAIEIIVEPEAKIDRPVLIRHIASSDEPVFVQTIVRVGINSSVKVIETFEGNGAFYSHTSSYDIGADSTVERLVLQDVDDNSVLNNLCAATLDTKARFRQTALSTGAKLGRQETLLHYNGDKIETELKSSALVSGRRHADFTSRIVHNGEGCVTRQIHKAAARDKGRAIFQGKFHVSRGAQKTDADMQANALLLSDTAEANHKPELEIYADDVECAHGSTAGALDEDALFYLRSRGLSEESARGFLINAFLAETVDDLDDISKSVFQKYIDRWLVDAVEGV